ncbi:MAG TPA: DMT family transporter [Gemmatimonadales bacterium]|nr:DMT family transporter [Gemmatimonadales bacterium]
MRPALLTTLALIAFAANSLLCRLALRSQAIDPASFSAIRIAAGALILALLVRWPSDGPPVPGGSTWTSAGLLFLYAAPFSFAYQHLSAGTGALLLFASVQVTMVLVALSRGERPRPIQWAGLVVAIAGLVYLVLPGLTAPDPVSAFLMLLAGGAWGFYSLRGRSTTAPLAQTAGNFARAVPMALVLCLVAWPGPPVKASGVLWAVLSGAIASGIGYALWYSALRQLTAMTAAIVQLAVPILAGAGGVLLLHEVLTVRLGLAAVLVLGGIAMAILGRAPAG